jgi:hypothetical protein
MMITHQKADKMQRNIEISVNPLAEYVTATTGRKKTIIKQQKNPPAFIIVRYATAKSNMKKFFKNGFSEDEIINGIKFLQGKITLTDFQSNDRKNSIEALRTFLKLRFPLNFRNLKCSFLIIKKKVMLIEEVNVRVAPDIVLIGEKNGITFYGGIKFHISKGQTFDNYSSLCAATAVKLFLKNEVAKEGEIVDPDYCLSIDVFGERVTPAPKDHSEIEMKLMDACKEIKSLWNSY